MNSPSILGCYTEVTKKEEKSKCYQTLPFIKCLKRNSDLIPNINGAHLNSTQCASSRQMSFFLFKR